MPAKARFATYKSVDRLVESIMNKKAKGICTAVSKEAVKKMKALTRIYASSASHGNMFSVTYSGPNGTSIKRKDAYVNSDQLFNSVTRSPTTKTTNGWVSNVYYDTDIIEPMITNPMHRFNPYYTLDEQPVDPEAVAMWVNDGVDYEYYIGKARQTKVHVVRKPAHIIEQTQDYMSSVVAQTAYVNSVGFGVGTKSYIDGDFDHGDGDW